MLQHGRCLSEVLLHEFNLRKVAGHPVPERTHMTKVLRMLVVVMATMILSSGSRGGAPALVAVEGSCVEPNVRLGTLSTRLPGEAVVHV